MKKLISFFVLLLLSVVAFSQTTVEIRGDTIWIHKNGGDATLKIGSITKDTLGAMINIGNGVTKFARFIKYTDSVVHLGNDSFKVGATTPTYITNLVNGLTLVHVSANNDSVYWGGGLLKNTVIDGHNLYYLDFDSTDIYLTGSHWTTPIPADSNNKVLVLNPTTHQMSVMSWPRYASSNIALEAAGHRVIISKNFVNDTALLNFNKVLPNITLTETYGTGLVITKNTTPADLYSNYITDSVYGSTGSDNWTQTCYFIPTVRGAAAVFGIGLVATQNQIKYNLRIYCVLTNNPASSYVGIENSHSPDWQGFQTGFAYAIGDLCKLEATVFENVITATLTDLVTGVSVKKAITNPYPLLWETDRFLHSIGDFGIYPYSSGFTVLKWQVTNNYDYADVAWIGTSITQGNSVDSAYKRYFNIVKGQSDLKFALNATSAAYIRDHAILTSRETFAYKPRYIIFDQACNDYLGPDTTVNHTLYRNMRDKAVRAGIIPIHVIPLPQYNGTQGYLRAMRKFIFDNFPEDYIFNDTTAFDSSGVIKSVYSTDGLHLTIAGHAKFAQDFIVAFPFLFKNTLTNAPAIGRRYSGTYIPTIDNYSNLTAGSFSQFGFHWFQVGNQVTVDGVFNTNGTTVANTNTFCDISLPVSSKILNSVDVVGGLGYTTSTVWQVGQVVANTTTQKAKAFWKPTDTFVNTVTVHFVYTIDQ